MEPNRTAGSGGALESQSPAAEPQQARISNKSQLAKRSDHVQGVSSHRPKPRQPARKGATEESGRGKSKEKINSQGKRKGRARPPLPALPGSSCDPIRPAAVQSQVCPFPNPFSRTSINPSDTTQHNPNTHSNDRLTSNLAERQNGLASQRTNQAPIGRTSGGDIRRPTEGNVDRVVDQSSPHESGAGRKSGRLREKGPTTYTAKGEIIRGGKRVNDEIHEKPFTKRARYEE